MPRPARRVIAATALAVVAVLGFATPALAESPDVPVAVAPEEGAFLEPGTVVLEWTGVEATQGYEVSWETDTGANAGTASTAEPSTAVEVATGSFVWRVRALPDGEWSVPATFHVDPQLPTLALPEEPAAVPATPAQGFESVPGGVWIAGALAFSAVFLVIVVIQSRLRREQDA